MKEIQEALKEFLEMLADDAEHGESAKTALESHELARLKKAIEDNERDVTDHIISNAVKDLNRVLESFAASYLRASGLKPQEVALHQQMTPAGVKYWFEPLNEGAK